MNCNHRVSEHKRHWHIVCMYLNKSIVEEQNNRKEYGISKNKSRSRTTETGKWKSVRFISLKEMF